MRLLAFVALTLIPATALAERITVLAAASLQTTLDPVAAGWEAATGDDVVLVYAGTSALARQIIAGAPADIFIAASADWMDAVEDGGMIRVDSRIDLAGNGLVLIGPAGAAPLALTGPEIAARLADGRLAMALVTAVPAGLYGKAALSTLGLWDGVADRVAQTDNVRGALALVALGEAPLGIVYATDALAEPRVTVVAAIPSESHPPIVYPAALTLDASAAAQAFLDDLIGPEAQARFAADGFLAPGG